MNVVEYNNIIDRLAVQVKSFQEGFSILAKAASLKNLGETFCHILRANFLISDVNLFYKKNIEAEWESIKVVNNNCFECLPLLKVKSEATFEFLADNKFNLVATLPLVDGAYWALIIGNKIDKSIINDLDKISIQMFFQLLDSAYQSFLNQNKEKQLNFSLNHRVVQLNSLIDTGIEISKLQKSSTLYELSLERAAALTNASNAVLQIISGEEIISEYRFPEDSHFDKSINSKKSIEEFVEFNGLKYLFILSAKESRNGIIDFDKTDEILLTAFAQQVLAAIENEHLHHEALEKERLHQEIETAASIQRRIIPQTLPNIEGYDLAGINIPSLEIGGDYYDVTKLSDGRYLLIIADVAGKGVASGLLVNTLNASLNVYLENDFILTEVAARLNKIIYKASTPEKYITGFIAILEPETGVVEYLNAGHNPIFHYSNNKLIKLDKGGFAFGMLDFGLPYESSTIKIEPGDKILFYTDGITEAMNRNGEEYSDEKLESFFLKENQDCAEIFIKNLIGDVKIFTANTPQSDDITALYLCRK